MKKKGNMMHLTYEHKPVMTLIGFSTLIRMEEGYTRCPEFWDVEYSRKYARLWQTGQPETPPANTGSPGFTGAARCRRG